MKVKDCVLIEPFTCLESDKVVEVAKKLRKTTLRHIFVVDNNHAPTGIISVLDINNRVVAESKDPAIATAKDIMSKPSHLVHLEDDADKLSRQMLHKGHVMNPVVKDSKIVGIITLNQLLARNDRKDPQPPPIRRSIQQPCTPGEVSP